MENLEKLLASIVPVDRNLEKEARSRLDMLTKPRGSLGILEDCAAKFVAATGSIETKFANPVILTFASDHGVAEEGVSAYPREVTVQMLANFAAGGAAVNVLARQARAGLRVIDVGAAAPGPFEGVEDRKVGLGTANIARGPAMKMEDAEKCVMAGAEAAIEAVGQGAGIIGTGDMGIANTTPAAAVYSVLLDMDPALTAGRGTGIDDDTLRKKIMVIEKAININNPNPARPMEVLAGVGGFEIGAICGAVLAASSKRVPVVVDGFISGAGALLALKMKPEILDYIYFSHLSAEAGHVNAMNAIGVKPLLDLKLRLGEGTGAALAFFIIEAGVRIMREMATFGEAGISGQKE